MARGACGARVDVLGTSRSSELPDASTLGTTGTVDTCRTVLAATVSTGTEIVISASGSDERTVASTFSAVDTVGTVSSVLAASVGNSAEIVVSTEFTAESDRASAGVSNSVFDTSGTVFTRVGASVVARVFSDIDRVVVQLEDVSSLDR